METLTQETQQKSVDEVLCKCFQFYVALTTLILFDI